VGIEAIINVDFEAKGELVATSLVRTITQQMILLRSYIQTEKLQGDPIHHRTGNLSRSLVFDVTRDGNTIIGTVGVSREAWYGEILEKGGTFSVRESVRTSSSGRSYSVRAHTMTFEPRSFMVSSLNEREATIMQACSDSVMGALAA
jgi:hypothetical protein